MRFLATFLCVSLFCPSALALSPRPARLPEAVFQPPSEAFARSVPNTPSDEPDRTTYAVGVLEMIFPDFRLQYPANLSDVDSLVISWPVHVLGMRTLGWPSRVGASLFVEPALPTNHTAFRGLGGLRAFAVHYGVGVVAEGGGILASDGSGAFVGAGPAVGGGNGVLALVGRRYFVGGEDRWDFTLDFMVPAVTLWEIFRRGKYGEE